MSSKIQQVFERLKRHAVARCGTGPMYSGKTEWLLGLAALAVVAARNIYRSLNGGHGNGNENSDPEFSFVLVRPERDTRGEGQGVSDDGSRPLNTHYGREYRAHNVSTDDPKLLLQQLHALVTDTTVCVLVDEAQFFTDECARALILFAFAMNRRGVQVYFATLDSTSELEPFGCSPILLAKLPKVQLYATCYQCGSAEATTSVCFHEKSGDVLCSEAGDTSVYQASCALCHPLNQT